MGASHPCGPLIQYWGEMEMFHHQIPRGASEWLGRLELVYWAADVGGLSDVGKPASTLRRGTHLREWIDDLASR